LGRLDDERHTEIVENFWSERTDFKAVCRRGGRRGYNARRQICAERPDAGPPESSEEAMREEG